MKMGKIKYSFSQAKKNIARNGIMSLASLFTIASCLIILGIFTIITANVNYITAQIKDQCEVQLFIKKDADENRVKEIGNEIKALDNIKEISLFTKDDMLSYAENDMFGDRKDLTTGLKNDNPFSDSYKIILDDIAQTSQTVAQLENIKDIDHVVNKQDLVNTVLSMSSVAKKISIGMMLLLFVISVVIISNTVKLTVFNRRKEINIMKYIGATDIFIKLPFVIEGMLIGFMGSVIAFGLVSWGYIALVNVVGNIKFEMFSIVDYASIRIIIACMFIFGGTIIGMIGSLISMRKYLRV